MVAAVLYLVLGYMYTGCKVEDSFCRVRRAFLPSCAHGDQLSAGSGSNTPGNTYRERFAWRVYFFYPIPFVGLVVLCFIL